jgi:hypothetical protein
VVIPTVHITRTPAPALQTIPTVTVRTMAPQPGMKLLPTQQQTYQEEQQAWDRAQQISTKMWAAQHQDEHVGQHVALNPQLTELYRCKATLGMKRAATIDFTKA